MEHHLGSSQAALGYTYVFDIFARDVRMYRKAKFLMQQEISAVEPGRYAERFVEFFDKVFKDEKEGAAPGSPAPGS